MALCPQSVSFSIPPKATYTINFQGVTIEEGNSIWCYSVTVTDNPGLSHWNLGVFELCPDQLREKLLSVTKNGVELQEITGYELGTFDGVTGIKFEEGAEPEESPVIYCIKLAGIYQSTAVNVAAKGGPTPAQTKEKALCGPSCETNGNGNGNGECQEITDLLESIALQEAGLAHILNAEGEAIQKALELQNVTLDDLFAINQSVEDTLIKVIKNEMILVAKLAHVNQLTCPCPCPE